ncbi:serine/threonine-protein kinase mos [Harmonia axyridis]|uniref:serine/threonine-protein kinase mos n=1 Tax=Harmonia axyridis TaxID=115357 RepID=UPI001E27616E|nr:serine/threonine-protein kinase mos [Harmonia axyridis]
MATPKSIKSIAVSLVKNGLSPRNTNFLEIPSPKFLGTSQNRLGSPISRKCLNFSQIQKIKRTKPLSVFDSKNPDLFFEEDVTIIKEKKGILINTPTKTDLMKNGLNDNGKLLDILGRGTFGTVVKGYYKNSLVAVKITRVNEMNPKPSDINAKDLSHENIVKVFYSYTKPSSEYAIIIMEYLDGARNLQFVLENGPILGELSKKKIIKQICLGLQYCHLNGILHLDVKPKNILVLPNQQCKLCDFGNSCRIEDKENYVYQGTIPYAAPELLRGMEPTEKSDVYSLGITIWQIEYRKSPYENWSSSKCLVYNVVKSNVRPEYEKNNQVITKLFLNCWKENPFSRLDLKEILEML